MFKQIMVIDVESRIPRLIDRLQGFSLLPPIVSGSVEEAKRHDGASATDAIIVSIYQSLTQDLLKELPNLCYIGILGSSRKKIPLEYCADRGIIVDNVTDYCDHDTAEWVMLKTLEFFRERQAPRSARSKLLGVIGVGAVGQQLISLARAFHMKVLFNSSSNSHIVDDESLISTTKEEIFSNCDVISIHTPAFLTWLTLPLLKLMKPGGCLINTCMGRIAIENDLLEFVKTRDDVTLILDKIAADYHPEIASYAQISSQPAFMTVDAQNLLVEKFFLNLSRAAA